MGLRESTALRTDSSFGALQEYLLSSQAVENKEYLSRGDSEPYASLHRLGDNWILRISSFSPNHSPLYSLICRKISRQSLKILILARGRSASPIRNPLSAFPSMRLNAFYALVLTALSVYATNPLRARVQQSRAYDEASLATSLIESTHTNLLLKPTKLTQHNLRSQPTLISAAVDGYANLNPEPRRDSHNTDAEF